MLYSLIVYLGLAAIMMLLTWIGGQGKRNRLLWAALASLAFAVVMGIRWEVGMDFPQYYRIYQKATFGIYSHGFERWEPGFKVIYWLFAEQGLHYSWAFGFIAFIQIFIVFYALKDYTRVWPWLSLTLMLTGIFISYDNIMRHMVAFSIFVYSLHFLADKKYWKYLLCILIAALFHKSALILVVLPLFYAWKKNYFKNLWVQFGLILLGLSIININYVQQIFETINVAMTLLDYDFYQDSKFAEFGYGAKISIYLYFLFACYSSLVPFSNKMKEYYNNRFVSIMYDLYFFGLFLKIGFFNMFLIQRFNYYFFSFQFIIAALTMYMLKQKKQWMYLGIVLFFYIVSFYIIISENGNNVVWYQTYLDMY